MMIYSNMVIHTCDYCPYKSTHAWVVRRHMVKKHVNKAPTSVSVPPVRRNHYGTGAPTNIRVGSSYMQARQGNRAPTTYREPGPNVGLAPTTVSVPPQQATSVLHEQKIQGESPYVCRHCNFHHAYKWVVTRHMYEKHPEYYTSAFTGQSKTGAPTTMSVPPVERDVQHGSGVDINIDVSNSDDDEETDDEMDTDDNEDNAHDILLNIGFHHGNSNIFKKTM